MRRRLLLVLGAALAAPPAHAQRRPHRLGLLAPGRIAIELFRALSMPELAREGFVEGRNLEVVERVSNGLGAPLRTAAAEILAARPDVVFAASIASVEAVRELDETTPVVMFGSTLLVGTGLAAGFARPGGNVTGVILLPEELDLKRVELARDAFPGDRPMGFLATAGHSVAQVEEMRAAAAALGVALVAAAVAPDGEPTAALARLREAGVGAVVVAASPILASRAADIAAHAASLRLPTVCEWRYMAEAGCTLSYGPLHAPLRRRNAQQIARILRGERPATIPIEIADRFETVVNLSAARRLGIEIPALVVARADEVIE